MNLEFENGKEIEEISSPIPPKSPLLQLSPKEFLLALSPEKPSQIKKNAKTFLHDFHDSASNLLKKMKEKYISELRGRVFDEKEINEEGAIKRYENFKNAYNEAEKLINGKIDIKLGIEILNESLDWIHPFYFQGKDNKVFEIYEKTLELTNMSFFLLASGNFKLKDYNKCIYFSKIHLAQNPNSVPTLQLLYSTYTHLGDHENANKYLSLTKKPSKISDRSRIKIILKKYVKYIPKSILFGFLTGITTLVTTKFYWKLGNKESLIYSLGTAFISLLTTIFFKNFLYNK